MIQSGHADFSFCLKLLSSSQDWKLPHSFKVYNRTFMIQMKERAKFHMSGDSHNHLRFMSLPKNGWWTDCWSTWRPERLELPKDNKMAFWKKFFIPPHLVLPSIFVHFLLEDFTIFNLLIFILSLKSWLGLKESKSHCWTCLGVSHKQLTKPSPFQFIKSAKMTSFVCYLAGWSVNAGTAYVMVAALPSWNTQPVCILRGLMEKTPDRERKFHSLVSVYLFILRWPWMGNLLGNKRIQGQGRWKVEWS